MFELWCKLLLIYFFLQESIIIYKYGIQILINRMQLSYAPRGPDWSYGANLNHTLNLPLTITRSAASKSVS